MLSKAKGLPEMREAWNRSFPSFFRRNPPCQNLISYFQPPGLRGKKFLFLKPPNWWYFVMAATRKSNNGVFKNLISCTCLFFFFFFLGPHPRHMEVPRLGIQSELQPLAYATATATSDPSCICDLHHSSRQHLILIPLSEARDQTRNLMVPSRIHFRCTTTGPPNVYVSCRSPQIFYGRR